MDIVRKCLLQALKAIANATPRIDFKTGFLFLMRYVPQCASKEKEKDKELSRAFEAANDAMTEAGKKSKTGG